MELWFSVLEKNNGLLYVYKGTATCFLYFFGQGDNKFPPDNHNILSYCVGAAASTIPGAAASTIPGAAASTIPGEAASTIPGATTSPLVAHHPVTGY
jgi:hypothetical protein